MRLTKFTDFALRALMLAASDERRTFSTEEIADALGISRNHLTKAIRDLAKADIVVTQRGSGGGFRLARPPEEISLGEVVRSLEDRYPLVECFQDGGSDCVLTADCRLRGELAVAQEAFYQALDATSLEKCAYRFPPAS